MISSQKFYELLNNNYYYLTFLLVFGKIELYLWNDELQKSGKEDSMITVRTATSLDRKGYYELWKLCFGDSDRFCDWFFANRFMPELSVCLETEGRIAACMQAFPYLIRIRGKIVDGAMLCGVCTHPSYRKRGFMGKIFTKNMQLLAKKGIAVAVHTPAELPSYFSFGHYPVADANYFKCNIVSPCAMPDGVYSLTEETWEMAYPCYLSFASAYSGIIWRTKEDFLRKCADYASDGGCAMAYGKKNVEAYVFYYMTDSEIICVEAVGESEALKLVLQGVFAQAQEKSVTVKLAPEVQISFPFGITERQQKGVMGAANLKKLLQSLELSSNAAFWIEDSVVPDNNGCYTLDGAESNRPPAFRMAVGRFLPVLVGYASLEEQRAFAEIYDEEGFQEIHEKLPKLSCYIIDEY